MTHLFRMMIIVSVLGFAACAAEVPFSSNLVTSESVLPDDAVDRRGDGVLRDTTGRPVGHDLLGQRLPDVSAKLADGADFSSDDLRGRWTVLVAWGVWCHDSRNDMDNIARLATHLSELDGIDFLSVHVPQSADHLDRMYRTYGSVEGYFEARGVSFLVMLDETSDIREVLKVQWTPTYLVIDPDLTVRGFRTDISKGGDGAWETFLQDVQELRSIP
ncbi:MAG: TlpA disulfide reductase family protein [Pseudomonadota bacterium]